MIGPAQKRNLTPLVDIKEGEEGNHWFGVTLTP